jgi:hypothetical protein
MSISPASVELRAYRGTPFIDVTDFEGFDYSAATFVLEVRAYRDKPGAALVAIGNATAGAQGVSVSVATTDGIPTSSVKIQINETTIEGLAFTSPRGGNLVLQYALDIAGGGHVKTRRMQGDFVVEASANG